jgi:hypothetical protein
MQDCDEVYRHMPLEVLVNEVEARIKELTERMGRMERKATFLLLKYEQQERDEALQLMLEQKGVQKKWAEDRTNLRLLHESVKTQLRSLQESLELMGQLRRVSPVVCCRWKEHFEGRFGDLREARWEWIEAGYSRWRVRLTTWGRVALLFWSLIRVKYQDLGF